VVAMWDGGWGIIRRQELYNAVSLNDLKRVNELITTKGVEVTWINEGDGGKTVLHKASELGHLEIVCFLLGLKKPLKDFLLNQRDYNQMLPIEYAQQKNHHQIFDLLQHPEKIEDIAILLMGNLKM